MCHPQHLILVCYKKEGYPMKIILTQSLVGTHCIKENESNSWLNYHLPYKKKRQIQCVKVEGKRG